MSNHGFEPTTNKETPAPQKLKVKRAKPIDIPIIVSIDQECFPSAWSEEIYTKELSRDLAVYFVARMGDDVVGYSLSWAIKEEFRILKIATIPGLRNMGIATALMKESFWEAKARGCALAFLEVRPSNIAAQNFYEKLGFQPLGIRKNYYTDTGEDGLTYVQRIDKLIKG
jgi:ribosomal-protein-alanine N-acetyltransferase